jgi:hypothetical protein
MFRTVTRCLNMPMAAPRGMIDCGLVGSKRARRALVTAAVLCQ